ncbi:MAG TPA: chitinase, partial [Kofleriaceae bacterium]|nr:chitinase [Kofleriaceae bacterium]
GFASLVSRSAFESMFPGRNPFYTYDGLVQATATYAEFAGAGDTAARKREAAAFLANVGHETGDLVYIEEIAQGEYCAPSGSCPCAPGQRYFGRGPIQLSWNYNYCAAGAALGLDLRADPGRVARDAKVAWQTGLWFWMTQSGAGSMPAHRAMVDGRGFGETIRTINGSLECNGGRPDQVNSRIERYRRFCQLLGVDPGANLGC